MKLENCFGRLTTRLRIVSLFLIVGQLSSAFEEPSNRIQEEILLDQSTLVQLQVIFRHGDRTPEKSYPGDPNKQLLEEMGLGQLTSKGKEQTYELGKFLRKRYSGFLNSKYIPMEVEASSSDTERTIMSALCVLAGCYPPRGSQVWTTELMWQPIPVRMLPKQFDHMLYLGSVPNCERRRAITFTATRSYNVQNREFYKHVSVLAGFNISTSEDLRSVTESVAFAKDWNVTLPVWMRVLDQQMQTLKDVVFGGFIRVFPDPYSKYLGVGALVGEVAHNMKNKTLFGDQDHKQLSLYGTHDSIVYGFLSILGVFNDLNPPLASAILIEQHRSNNGTYYVQMLYRNDTSNEPIVLSLPDCPSIPCSLDEFLNLTDPLIPKDIDKECSLLQSRENDVSSSKPLSKKISIGQSLGIMFGVIAALALVTAAIGLVVMRNRSQTRNRSPNRNRASYSELGRNYNQSNVMRFCAKP